jgi:glucose-6-phosphate 1-dehydrogenase
MSQHSETLLLFGATGDLSRRMLLPSLYALHSDELIAPNLRIFGTARSEHDDASFRSFAKEALCEFLPDDRKDEGKIDAFLSGCTIRRSMPRSPRALPRSPTRLATFRADFRSSCRPRPSCSNRPSRGCTRQGSPETMSASVLKSRWATIWPPAANQRCGQRRLSRKPHLPHRPLSGQGNGAEPDGAALSPICCSSRCGTPAHIEHVQITVSETVGLEGRAGLLRRYRCAARYGAEPYAATARADRDGAAGNLDATAIRDEKVKVLRALACRARRCRDRPIWRRRGQGCSRCQAMTAIWASDSDTETFVAIKAMSIIGAGRACLSICAPASAC